MLELNLILVLFLKPLVIIINVFLLVVLGKMKALPDVSILFWAMLFFLLGELACAVDVYGTRQMTLLNEGFHDAAMLVAFCCFFYWLYKFMLQKVGCLKSECPGYKTCELNMQDCEQAQRTGSFPVWLLLTGIVLAILPMLSTRIIHQADMQAGFNATVIGAYCYNRTDQLFVLQQIIFPVISIFAFVAGIIITLVTKKLTMLFWKFVSLGAGSLAFVYFRVVLINLFHPNIIFTALGEEMLELMFVALLLLWLYPQYRSQKSKPK